LIAIQGDEGLLFLDAVKLSRFLFKDKSENTFINMSCPEGPYKDIKKDLQKSVTESQLRRWYGFLPSGRCGIKRGPAAPAEENRRPIGKRTAELP
jgi:hypothetical protein